jgi:hypothetical protein
VQNTVQAGDDLFAVCDITQGPDFDEHPQDRLGGCGGQTDHEGAMVQQVDFADPQRRNHGQCPMPNDQCPMTNGRPDWAWINPR